jgi:enamine deaminase RidA (YjgF/YER057c/UK114 family)
MIKALSLAAALALLPFSAAVAQDARGPAEDQLEAAGDAFEARMDEFGDRAEAISDDASLTSEQRGARIAALWAEYQPDVQAFTAMAARLAPQIAQEALADLDVDAIVSEAMAEVNASGALQMASGVAANGAWASNDPEHAATMGLMVDYAIGEASDAIDEAVVEADQAAADATAPQEPAAPADEA